MNNLTLIIPAKNEKESLPLVLQELKSKNFNIHVILEKSDEKTINAISNLNCKIIFQRNKGYGDAIIQGIQSVETKFFCIFNADGSFDPKEINLMIDKLNHENLDLIFGSRYEKNSGSDDDTFVTKIGNFIFTLLGNLFFRLNITDILYTFVLGKLKRFKNKSCKK